MQYTINELRETVLKPVYDVYEIFKSHFGEEYVDLQNTVGDGQINLAALSAGATRVNEGVYEISETQLDRIKEELHEIIQDIIVWWPEVTVTNENGRSVLIKDLFAKVEVNGEGMIPYQCHGFWLNRTTFTELQFTSGYMHSHIQRVNGIPRYSLPCLGRGPIQNTIVSLKSSNEDILWMLFCEELSRYVTVESLKGVPYIKMESIGERNASHHFPAIFNNIVTKLPENLREYKDFFKDFTKWYLEHGNFSFNYTDENFVSGLSCYDFLIDISNAFIQWYNLQSSNYSNYSWLLDLEILRRVHVSEGNFYSTSNHRSNTFDYRAHDETPILRFKDRVFNLRVEDSPEENSNLSLILDYNIAMYILNTILSTVNYYYTNERTNIPESGSTGQSSSSAYQTVTYL